MIEKIATGFCGSKVLLLTAVCCLGGCVKFNDGAEALARGDYGKALGVWSVMAEYGDADAQNQLGVLYNRGLGTTRDDVEAARLFAAAASQNHPGACNNLGLMYRNGTGVARNAELAVRWFRKSAALGNTDADRKSVV